MKLWMGLAMLAIAGGAQAAVRMDLVFRKGGQSHSLTILTRLNQTAFASEVDDTRHDGIEIVATPKLAKTRDPSGQQVIEMKIELSEIRQNQRVPLTRTKIISLVGDSATLSESRPGGEHFELSVRPTFQ